jgi:hypothetical protein
MNEEDERPYEAAAIGKAGLIDGTGKFLDETVVSDLGLSPAGSNDTGATYSTSSGYSVQFSKSGGDLMITCLSGRTDQMVSDVNQLVSKLSSRAGRRRRNRRKTRKTRKSRKTTRRR